MVAKEIHQQLKHIYESTDFSNSSTLEIEVLPLRVMAVISKYTDQKFTDDLLFKAFIIQGHKLNYMDLVLSRDSCDFRQRLIEHLVTFYWHYPQAPKCDDFLEHIDLLMSERSHG